jgi:hypothetical protein
VKQVVIGDRVCINLNGEPVNYFTTFKSLSQGDPLSLLLFKHVADALATLLKKARDAGFVRGLVAELVEGGFNTSSVCG